MKKYLIIASVVIVLAGTGVYVLTGRHAHPAITAERAAQIVADVPEVKAWKAAFGGATPYAGVPVIALASETSEYYTVQVFENLPDHTATFGWYAVDKTSGAVHKITP